MQATQSFHRTMQRVEALVSSHARESAAKGRGRPPQALSDVLRGALVLAVAALDAVVLDCIVEAVPQLAARGALGGAAIKKFRPQDLLDCFSQADPHQAFSNLCRASYRAVTFQTAKAIESNLAESLGCSAPWAQAAKRLSDPALRWEEKSHEATSWNAANVIRQLDEYVNRRHRIAHDGDRTPDAKRTSPIRRDYVADATQFLREIGIAVHDVIDAHVTEAVQTSGMPMSPTADARPQSTHGPARTSKASLPPAGVAQSADYTT